MDIGIKHSPLPMDLAAVTLPDGFEAIDVVSGDYIPAASVLMRHMDTRLYILWHGGAVHGIDQRKAARYTGQLRLKRLAETTGKTIKAIGLEIGIPERTIWDWSRGAATPPDYVLDLLEEHYGL